MPRRRTPGRCPTALASTLQTAVGDVIDVDDKAFVNLIDRLAAALPEPINVAERRELKAQLMEFTQRIGDDFHVLHHRGEREPGCPFLPIECAARIWFDSSIHPRLLLPAWASAYTAEFSRHHLAPFAVRAARLLQQRSGGAPDIGSIVEQLDTSRSVLARLFKQRFGMTPIAYHTRVRLRRFVVVLRESSIKVSAAAEAAGYRSAKVYQVLKKATGLTPALVRGLSSAEFDRLLNDSLRIDWCGGSRTPQQNKPTHQPA